MGARAIITGQRAESTDTEAGGADWKWGSRSDAAGLGKGVQYCHIRHCKRDRARQWDCQTPRRDPPEVCNHAFKGSPADVAVCLCSNTVSCLGIEVSSHAWEWMVGLLHRFKHEEGFCVQWVTSCLLPFPYLVSLGQAACSLVLERVPFCSSCGLDPTSPFSYLLGGWCCCMFTPLPSAFCECCGLQESRANSVVSPSTGDLGGASQLLRARWAVLPAGAAALVGVRLPSCRLSPLLEGRPRTGDASTGACFQWLPDAVPYLPGYFVSVILWRFFSAWNSLTPCSLTNKRNHIWSNNLSYIILFT